MLLASDINEHIFSYLFAPELCSAFATCKHWQSSKNSKSSAFIWFNLYRHLVESPKLITPGDNLPWCKKVCDLYSSINSSTPFTLSNMKPENPRSDSLPPRLVCRSGHTASLFYCDNQEMVVLFGGATHFYTFVNTYDILLIKDGMPLRTYATIDGDVPTARWLHKTCSFENNQRAFVFGGQV
jgi:hypothetical protein